MWKSKNFKVQNEGQNHIKIEFKDNGIGISKQRKKDIFKRSYEINQQGKGTGIGLSLVKEIINMYGGEVWVENRVKGDYSQGSNFIILLGL
ncbi:MAG: HAMP domain-containing sensor histidine kinase [Promethearchaeia archaeon]